jgi:hypothetical protein
MCTDKDIFVITTSSIRQPHCYNNDCYNISVMCPTKKNEEKKNQQNVYRQRRICYKGSSYNVTELCVKQILKYPHHQQNACRQRRICYKGVQYNAVSLHYVSLYECIVYRVHSTLTSRWYTFHTLCRGADNHLPTRQMWVEFRIGE